MELIFNHEEQDVLKACGITEEDAVNLFYLKHINDIQSTAPEKADYTEQATEVMASGEWRINFNTGSAQISSSSTSELEKIYNLLIQAENTKLTIVGHTDNVGNPDSNLTLSKNRAESVTGFFTSKGVAANRFTTKWFGEEQPVADNATPEGRAKNRRVNLAIVPNEKMIEDAKSESGH